jgi:hypothetical protein
MVSPWSYFKDYEAEAKGGIPPERLNPKLRVPRLAAGDPDPEELSPITSKETLRSGCVVFEMRKPR